MIQLGHIDPFAGIEIFDKPLCQLKFISLCITFSQQLISKVADTEDHAFQFNY